MLGTAVYVYGHMCTSEATLYTSLHASSVLPLPVPPCPRFCPNLWCHRDCLLPPYPVPGWNLSCAVNVRKISLTYIWIFTWILLQDQLIINDWHYDNLKNGCFKGWGSCVFRVTIVSLISAYFTMFITAFLCEYRFWMWCCEWLKVKSIPLMLNASPPWNQTQSLTLDYAR